MSAPVDGSATEVSNAWPVRCHTYCGPTVQSNELLLFHFFRDRKSLLATANCSSLVILKINDVAASAQWGQCSWPAVDDDCVPELSELKFKVQGSDYKKFENLKSLAQFSLSCSYNRTLIIPMKLNWNRVYLLLIKLFHLKVVCGPTNSLCHFWF